MQHWMENEMIADPDRVLTREQVDQFGADGFLLPGPRVLTSVEIEELRAELDRVLAESETSVPRPVLIRNLGGNPEAPVWQIVNIWQASEPYRRLMHNPVIVSAIAQLIGSDEVRIWHDQIQYKPAERGGANHWHQDSPSWPVLTPMTQVTAWVALDDVAEDNGCMSMVVGSHHWGNHLDFLEALPSLDAMPSRFQGHPVQRALCPVDAGQVHFHHGLTWHASQPNRSGRPRRAIALHYMSGETRYVSTGKTPMDQFVNAADGSLVKGDRFPVVFSNARPVPR